MTTRFVQTGDARTAYEVHGRGPALVLMHGAEASRQMFAGLIPLLAERFTVIAYDQRDCGETETPEHAATLADLAHDAHALVTALGYRRAHVFGSSFGGRVAQALAVLHPETVDRLVLGSTWPLPLAYEDANPEGAAEILALRQRLPETAEELAGWFFPEPFLRERPELRRIFAQVRAASARTGRRAETTATTVEASATSIACPTLVVVGELDRVVPPRVTLAMGDRMPHGRQHILPGIGHVTAMQAPAELARAITAFLTADQPTRREPHVVRT